MVYCLLHKREMIKNEKKYERKDKNMINKETSMTDRCEVSKRAVSGVYFFTILIMRQY